MIAKTIRIATADLAGIGVIALAGSCMFVFRQLAVVPRATVGLCAAAQAPAFCTPRGWVLHLQYYQAFGWAALLLGLAGFVTGHRWASICAVAIGAAAVINYNATTGIIGAALGLVAWIGLGTGRYQASA